MSQSRDELLAAYLNASDHRCATCRHPLRGASSGRCPECGEPILLSPASPSGAGAWWLMAVFGSVVNVGMASMLAIQLLRPVASLLGDRTIVMLVNTGRAPRSALPDWVALAYGLALLIAAGALLCALVGWRRPIGAMPGAARVSIGLAGLLSPLLVLLVIRGYVQLVL